MTRTVASDFLVWSGLLCVRQVRRTRPGSAVIFTVPPFQSLFNCIFFSMKMSCKILCGVVCLAMILMGVCSSSSSGRTNITFYGQTRGDDGGIGYSGVDLNAYGRVAVMWSGRRVYPVAVPTSKWRALAFKIIKVQGAGIRTIYGHVVDQCADGSCSKNARARGYNMVVDIHRTGFKAAGKSDGVIPGSFRVVGSLSPKIIPRSLFTPKVRDGSASFQCRTGNNKSFQWIKLSQRGRCS